MQDGDDIDCIVSYAIDHDIGQSGNDEHPGSFHNSRPTGERKKPQSADGMLDASDYSACSNRVVDRNVFMNFFNMPKRARLKANLHLVRRSNTLRTSASSAYGSLSARQRSIS